MGSLMGAVPRAASSWFTCGGGNHLFGGQAGVFFGHEAFFLPEARHRFPVHQAQVMAPFREAQVGVVLPEEQAVFGPGGEQAVGLPGALGDQIVHQHGHVGLGAVRQEGRAAGHGAGSVDPGPEALGRGLLVARSAVDLPGHIQARDSFGLEGGLELGGVDEIVLDGVGRPHDLHFLQARHGSKEPQLDRHRQAVPQALGVDLLGVPALPLQGHLVAGLVGEPHHLVLKGRAVAGAHPGDDPAVQGGKADVVADDAVGLSGGVADKTRQLLHGQGSRAPGKGPGPVGLLPGG